MIQIAHGANVEIGDRWFCEAVWDGEFEEGGFDRTDLVFGSGATIAEGRVTFVSSGSTVDRLQVAYTENGVLVSNSLVCLLVEAGLRVDGTYGRFPDFFWSIVKGIDGYERSLPVQKGRVDLVYFRNLVWDGRKLGEVDKPVTVRDFGTYASYRSFLDSAIGKVAENARSKGRLHCYEMIGGLSSGYDSTAVTVLARDAGMRRVFSFRSARGGEEDHGQQAADALGLELKHFERTDWMKEPFAEVPYIVGSGIGVDVNFGSVSETIRGRLLVSGFHGDKVWAKTIRAAGPEIVRGDLSGLSLTEARLSLGCIHFPVPFMGVRQVQDIHRLSNSEGLEPWDVGGNYSRPICRRIAEEAGVPREAFGMRKRAVTNLFHRGDVALSGPTRAEFYRWLDGRETDRAFRRVVSPSTLCNVVVALSESYGQCARVVRRQGWTGSNRLGRWVSKQDQRLQRLMNRHINQIGRLFPWAVEHAGANLGIAKDLPSPKRPYC